MNTKRVIDANIILRYILRDNDNDFEIVKGYHRKEEKFVMQFQKNEKNLNFWNGYNNTCLYIIKKVPDPLRVQEPLCNYNTKNIV